MVSAFSVRAIWVLSCGAVDMVGVGRQAFHHHHIIVVHHLLIQADDFFQQLVGLAGPSVVRRGQSRLAAGCQAEQAGGEVAGALGPGAGVALLRHRFDKADFQATALSARTRPSATEVRPTS